MIKSDKNNLKKNLNKNNRVHQFQIKQNPYVDDNAIQNFNILASLSILQNYYEDPNKIIFKYTSN